MGNRRNKDIFVKGISTTNNIGHGLGSREFDQKPTKKIHHSYIEQLSAIFDETLNPKDKFWTTIGWDQAELTKLLSDYKIPQGISPTQLIDAIKSISIVED